MLRGDRVPRFQSPPISPGQRTDDHRVDAAQARNLRVHVRHEHAARTAGSRMTTDTREASAAPGTIVIPVTGMTCAACEARVQRTLSKTPGVVDASVNLMMGNGTVSIGPSATSPETLVERIRATGYGARVPTADRTAFEEQE